MKHIKNTGGTGKDSTAKSARLKITISGGKKA